MALILVAASNTEARPSSENPKNPDTVKSSPSVASLANPDNSPDKPAGAAVDNSDYVGADTCKPATKAIYNQWEKTPALENIERHARRALQARLRGVPRPRGGSRCRGR